MTTTDDMLPIEPAPETSGEAALEAVPAVLMPEPPPARRGVLALLAGVVLWPRSTFAYLRDWGGRAWMWPVLAALVLTVTARLIAVPIERAQAQAAMEALQAQLEEQAVPEGGDNMVIVGSAVPAGGFSFGPGPMGARTNSPLTDYGLPAVGVLGQWLVGALVLLMVAWLLGGRPRASAMLRMSAWALLVPVTARALVAITVMLAAGRVPVPGLTALPANGGPALTIISSDDLPSEVEGGAQLITRGPGGMVEPSTGAMYLSVLRGSFLSSLDIYTVWGLGLLVIGLAVTARFNWFKALGATAAYWGVSLALAALPPALSFGMMTLTGAGSVIPLP